MSNFDTNFELEAASFNLFNFDAFRQFLVEKGVLATAISYVIAKQINNLIASVMDNFVKPLLAGDFNNDGKDDLEKLKEIKNKIGPFNFTLGQLLFDLFKFVLVMYSVFVISRLFIDTVN